MASMFFQTNKSQSEINSTSNNQWIGSISSDKLVVKDESKLILFMIGGSAASIYSPLLRLFLKELSNNYIVPIFIDRQFHSSSTARAIEEITYYEEFCRLSLTESSSTEPLLFVDECIEEILHNEVFKRTIGSIRNEDNVFICASIHSEFNTNFILQLSQVLSLRISPNKIGYGLFLPYLKFETNDHLSKILSPEKDEIHNATLNINLRNLWSSISKESPAFIVGLSHKSIVARSDYQVNPFNLVHLIMAYAASASSNVVGGWYDYGVQQANSFLSPKEVIQSDIFRTSLIFQDFSSLVFNFLMREDCLPEELKEDSKLIDLLQNYLNATSQLVLSLGDATSNKEICLYIRDMSLLNITDINLNFRKKTFFRDMVWSKKELSNEIYKYIDTSKIVNPNMAANQILFAIQMFIQDNLMSISKLYF